jgi:hypothetical protein
LAGFTSKRIVPKKLMTISPVIREVQLNTCNKYYREHMLKEYEEKLERKSFMTVRHSQQILEEQ